ncbi:MAG: DUF222 domain-containing protein [Granulosicoccus sp.]
MEEKHQNLRYAKGNDSRIAMAIASCAHGAGTGLDDDVLGEDTGKVAIRMRELSRALDRGTCRLVLLLPQFDRQKEWKSIGARSCTAWLNSECGISPSAGNDRLRVAYALENLPIITQLFQLGELSWSKVRALTRIATPDNERTLASRALDMSASAIEQLSRQYRDKRTRDQLEDEDAKAVAAEENRAMHYYLGEDGMVHIKALLAPLAGAAFLKSMARAEDVLYESMAVQLAGAPESTAKPTSRQLRADAMMLMAEVNFAAAQTDIRTADRYQVMVHVDAATLQQTLDNPDPFKSASAVSRDTGDTHSSHSVCAHIENGFAIAASTARRLVCDCSISTLVSKDGEPMSIGRKSRVWPAAMRRAILARDRHCQFPGCDASRHVDVHHIRHWVDGGETSVENGVTVCAHHHRLLHEHGYRVERTATEGGERKLRTVIVENADGQQVKLSSGLRRFKFLKKDGCSVY